jgi:hypothetical protein
MKRRWKKKNNIKRGKTKRKIRTKGRKIGKVEEINRGRGREN